MANIPTRLWRIQSGQYMSKARDLFDYLRGGLYATDLTEHRGVCLSGKGELRSDLLAMLAKSQAAAGQSVMFTTVHQLLYWIENDADKRAELAKIKNLYVDGFEREFNRDTYDCPYTFYQQVEVEEFLKVRIDGGLVNNFATSHKWADIRWWSRDFLAFHAEYIRDIAL